MPAPHDDALKLALPEPSSATVASVVPSSVTDASGVAPSCSATLPEGAIACAPATATFGTIDDPKMLGFAAEVRVTAAPSWFTAWPSAAEVLAEKCASPAYAAVIR